jgi:hypothetical protein
MRLLREPGEAIRVRASVDAPLKVVLKIAANV